FKQIAWEGISILEAVSTTNELSIILNDKDVDRAFSVLKQSYV
ncbi:MAG: aspartate kinase, partial [Bacteroidales bacterium]|nr:aspartate kinase [Bacteroidales bacterium]